MKTVIERAQTIHGTIRVPGDKSIAHRSLILGALARGDHVIEGLPASGDVTSTIECLRRLGVAIERASDGRTRVKAGPFASGEILDAGNSGTTTRLMAGLIAGHPIASGTYGDPS